MTTKCSIVTESAKSKPITVPSFAVISGAQVLQTLQGRENQIVELVEATYRLHSAGDSVNPPSYFLCFPVKISHGFSKSL
jgi:ornithine cyclodeaminase